MVREVNENQLRFQSFSELLANLSHQELKNKKDKLDTIPQLMLKGFHNYRSLEEKIAELVQTIQ